MTVTVTVVEEKNTVTVVEDAVTVTVAETPVEVTVREVFGGGGGVAVARRRLRLVGDVPALPQHLVALRQPHPGRRGDFRHRIPTDLRIKPGDCCP